MYTTYINTGERQSITYTYDNSKIYKEKDLPFKYSGGFREYKLFNGVLASKDFCITKVVYNDPATIVFWSDNTKTVCKATGGDVYSPETGLAICITKKLASASKVHDIFKDWLPEDGGNIVTIKDVRRKSSKKDD